jgi:predicted Zn-dependent protease
MRRSASEAIHAPHATRTLFAILAILLLAPTLHGCAINPVTGQRELTLMSEGQEIQLGAQSDGAIVAQYGLLDDAEAAAYVQGIGARMVPVSHRPDLEFHFRVLDDPVVNAFALPGGYVYITRGILTYLNSEAGLAGVVGHEIGHVTARHGVQRYSQQALLGLGLGLGSVLSETFANYAGLAGQAGQLLLLKYGRDDERQSDQLGVEYATKIGYDTNDMAGFFYTLHRLSPEGGRLPSWMSTHPDPGERVGNVQALTTQWQGQTAGPYSAKREEFLRVIDGLVFGQDPREGFVRGNTFHHPQLKFRFPVPQGWQLQNGKSQVLMVSPESRQPRVPPPHRPRTRSWRRKESLRSIVTRSASPAAPACALSSGSRVRAAIRSWCQRGSPTAAGSGSSTASPPSPRTRCGVRPWLPRPTASRPRRTKPSST